MNPEVVISGAWEGFEKGVSDWAKGTSLSVKRTMGMVLCSSDIPEDLQKLLQWLREVVSKGRPENVASFESALFPPLQEGGNPTLVRGRAEERKNEEIAQLPNIAATPRSIFRSESRA
ncbi:hypothetical protein [Prosthecobacter sp.]|uniref:hypothetical protein n=1 Tax=Prosthecobacter sp. TaxID=1965333 RepID=UPI003783EFB3